MSTTTSRTSRTGTVPTRQQLDELDALLQRMLELPVQSVEESSPPVAPRPSTRPSERRPVDPIVPPRVDSSAGAASGLNPVTRGSTRLGTQGPPIPASPRPSTRLGTQGTTVPRSPTSPTPQGGEGKLPSPSQSTLTPPSPSRRSPETQRSYPPSYMVVEDAGPPLESPIPGGQHDLTEGLPADPVQEQAQALLRQGAPGNDAAFETAWRPSAQTWGPLAETWRQTQPAPASPNIPTYQPPPQPKPQATPSPSVWTQTVVISDAPSSEDIPAAPAPAPVVQYGPTVGVVPPSPLVAPDQNVSATQPAPLPKFETPIYLWPLVAFNFCFDVFLWPLGPVGQWMRGPSGGVLLAMLGLLGLVAAGALVLLDGIGWN